MSVLSVKSVMSVFVRKSACQIERKRANKNSSTFAAGRKRADKNSLQINVVSAGVVGGATVTDRNGLNRQ